MRMSLYPGPNETFAFDFLRIGFNELKPEGTNRSSKAAE